jgi:hypothetical protein
VGFIGRCLDSLELKTMSIAVVKQADELEAAGIEPTDETENKQAFDPQVDFGAARTKLISSDIIPESLV